LDGISSIKIFGQSDMVKMKIEDIEAFSAHAGMDDLQRWLNNFKSPPKHVFLTHGEEESMLSLEKFLQSKGSWEVSAPKYMEEYDL
jgi:metallo-beta-lactamase family protein